MKATAQHDDDHSAGDRGPGNLTHEEWLLLGESNEWIPDGCPVLAEWDDGELDLVGIPDDVGDADVEDHLEESHGCGVKTWQWVDLQPAS